jgi:hypothetical protein
MLRKWVPLRLAAILALFANPSCSSTPPPTSLAASCSINSDCEGDLVCVFGRCHIACRTSKDCTGETCLPPGVCELPQESSCSTTLPCVSGLTCADDFCRAPCVPNASNGSTGGCLGTQTCESISGSTGPVCMDNGGDGGGADARAGDATVSDAHRDSASDARHDAPNADACVVPDGSPKAGPLGFVPSNFNPLALLFADGGPIPTDGGPEAGVIDWSHAPDAVIDADCVTGSASMCLGVSPVTITIAQGPPTCEPACLADLYVLNSLLIESGVSLTLSYSPDTNPASRPIILAVRTTAQIQGTLNVSAAADFVGPGGFPFATHSLGPGGGGNGEIPAQYPNSDPGGGAFCGSGGRGGFTSGMPATGGGVYGLATIIPLQGGSAGGWADNLTTYPGAGGGGVQISAGSNIVVSTAGVINANGGGYYGGGGSGGAILLEAPTVMIHGVVVANGGSGGSYLTSGHLVGQNGQLNDTPAVGYYDGGNGGAGSTVNGTNGGVFDAGDASTYVSAGGGGAGWIRINTACGPVITEDSGSTFVSPGLDSGCASTGPIQY